ncbi:MAG: sensor histidine kinase [Cyanobacteria bacterium CRU_2_1]|nr:sensor histidine kinase [Cyanobacteria bacterium RU_5_0]NJR58505.1 sensor histidine kinase [Cyanobacteria bacterium CRU_2_1]
MCEIMNELFAALNQVVLERIDNRSFHLIGTMPDWFGQFFSEISTAQSRFSLEKTFPFLENFLIDAEHFWQESDRGVLKSGFWSEPNPQGQDYQLEALAVCLSDKKILLIELAESAYQEKYALLQTGRDNQLSYDSLVKEIQKKEILLHCIFHDLVGQITAVSNCLELLGLESLSVRGRDYISVGRRQINQQAELVQEILQAFSAEMELLQNAITDPTQAPDLLICTQNVVDMFLPSFLARKKHLQMHPEIERIGNWKVIGERSRLERILLNLVENALRHTPEGSTVQINLHQEEEFILCTVDDQGLGVPPESVKYLFQRFFQVKGRAGKAGLGLYFCRITVKRWGGAIGYEPLAEGGARFWFRLRKFELHQSEPTMKNPPYPL